MKVKLKGRTVEEYEVLKTDVLIIGGGAAGLRAAIEAQNKGVEVCLLSKGPLGGSGSTPLASHSLQAAFGTNDSRDNPYIHYQDIIIQGRYLADQNIAWVLAYEIIPRVFDLEKFGVRFKKEDGKFFLRHHPGQTYPRSLYIIGGGFGLISGLRKELRRYPQVKILEDFFVSRLLKDQGEVVGAFGLWLRNGRFYAFEAKSIILACGGYEELWGNTDTAPDSTGDGIYLAHQVGADIIDLEMIEYYPTVLAYPESVKGILIGYETFLAKEYLGFKLVNNNGKEFLPESPLPARDVLIQRIFAEIERGGGTTHNAVYIDPGRSSRNYEEIDELLNNLFRDTFKSLRKLGIDTRKDRIEVHPAVHYTLGGIHINEKTETSVQGLFAAGENSSNVHGANRISGNSLADTQVFGARAGKYASERAKKRSQLPIPIKDVKEEIQKWNYFIVRKGMGIRASALRKELKQIMDEHIGPRRKEEGMKKALQMVLDIKQNGLPLVQLRGARIFNVDWRLAIEICMCLDLAELVIRSALFRKETRGHHFRSDFTKTLKSPQHTIVRNKNNETNVLYSEVRNINK